MIFAADQGAIVSVNGGRTWSSWYNQPTAQLYHVSTDNNFPYWVYGGQQESGAIGIASRGNGGQISFRDWMGVGSDEYAYVAADPKNPDIIYGGRVLKFNKKTGQTQFVGPEVLKSGNYRTLRTMPLLFHPADDQMLLFGTNVLWKTRNGGQDWEVISPDLTRKQPDFPASIGDFMNDQLASMSQRAVVYSISGSPLDKDIIWAGTDDGLVHVTWDGGKTWKEVTPKAMSSWDKVSQIDAGHFDKNTCYISVNSIKKDDMKPHIFKTHDGGATWIEITSGMNPSGPVNVVREDPLKAGLLYAGTEREVYFSADDGSNWQSLRQNMPATSIRDLVIHENDLVIGTHGRSIWIMDELAPLRGIAETMASKSTQLYSPGVATRVRFNMFSDTPLPPEEPTGQNPPDGAYIDYLLINQAKNVTIEILDSNGQTVQTYSSNDIPEPIDSLNYRHPVYWIRPQSSVETTPGHHRIVWNLRYSNPTGAQREYSISAVQYNTASGPVGPLVAPGDYTIKLIADGEVLNQKIHVRMDPRVSITEMDLALQTSQSLKVYNAYKSLQYAREQLDMKLNNPKAKWKKGKREEALTFRGSGNPSDGDIVYGSIYELPIDQETLVGLQSKLLHLLKVLQSADAKPTQATIQACDKLIEVSEALLKRTF